MKTILNIALQITANTARGHRAFHAFLGGQNPRHALGRTFRLGSGSESMEMLAAGHRIGEPALLFEKIEDEVIDRQLAKLAATKGAQCPC